MLTGGVFREAEVSELLTAKPIGGSSASVGTRCLADNLSDLRAQVAANTRGIHLVADLISQYGLRKVQAYMNHILNNAEGAVREMLKAFGRSRLASNADTGAQIGTPEVDSETQQADASTVSVTASDRLDDGSVIALKIDVDLNTGDAVFDFTGTGEELWGNLNAPPAVTYSAVIYCMRCLVGQDIPLNQGCLRPVKIIIPNGSLLHPSPEAGVVGGNVLTSQRVVDVVLKAFNACAASQGCMNNLTFGDDEFGYYETIAGGAGAGPTWHGSSGVHTHMTNTRITDPEILERRYPVIVREFALRRDSGGAGRFRGGEGVVRDLEFRRPLVSESLLCVGVCMHIFCIYVCCVYACMCSFIVCVVMYICTYVCMYVCMDGWMDGSMFLCFYVSMQMGSCPSICNSDKHHIYAAHKKNNFVPLSLAAYIVHCSSNPHKI
jgi:5-oxoprolinase (ATP-hydrolysing)